MWVQVLTPILRRFDWKIREGFYSRPLSIVPYNPIGSMGVVYLPTWMAEIYGFHVGKYSSPMDPMGITSLNTNMEPTKIGCL